MVTVFRIVVLVALSCALIYEIIGLVRFLKKRYQDKHRSADKISNKEK